MATSAAASAMPAQFVSLPTDNSQVLGPGQKLDQNAFLKLLTAELENQDPLNPLSGADFAAQLANFSTATGVQGVETELGSLGTELTASSGLQAASLIGRMVAVDGSLISLPGQGPAKGAFNLSSAASDVKVTVADGAGVAVASLDLGALPAGIRTFQWDGQRSDGTAAPAGTYAIQVTAADASGNAVGATPYAVVQVLGIDSAAGSAAPMADLDGGLAPVPLSGIHRIF